LPTQAIGEGTSDVSIVLSAFPKPKTLDPVAGTVLGLPGPSDQFKIAMFDSVQLGAWYIKPYANPPSSFPVAVDGTFFISNWASYPIGDINWNDITLVVLPNTANVVDSAGGPIDAGMTGNANIIKSFPAGYAPANTAAIPNPPAQQGNPNVNNNNNGGVTITITAFPATDATTRIAGIVNNLPAGGPYVAILYLEQASGGSFWRKPFPASFAPIDTNGGFSIDFWASYPATDHAFKSMDILIFSAQQLGTLPNVEGIGLPLGLTGTALAIGSYPRGYTPVNTQTNPGSIFITKFPPLGATTAIQGTVQGVLQNANNLNAYVVFLYLVNALGNAYVKPYPNTPITIAADGMYNCLHFLNYTRISFCFIFSSSLFFFSVQDLLKLMVGLQMPQM
jgi:hypothetical protein